ncbi:MAG: hypothetical protein ACYTFI_22695 [Planctomycetota bacterium]
MGDAVSTPEASRPIRFPFVAAALCAVSLAAAGWLFFRYSYAWDVRPDDFPSVLDGPGHVPPDHPMLGWYVRLRGVFHEDRSAHRGRMTEASPADHVVPVLLDWTEPLPAKETEAFLQGRVVQDWGPGPYLSPPRACMAVDCAQGRWHGATVAGLVVAAWGAFVFAAALRHWLGFRRAQGALTGRSP